VKEAMEGSGYARKRRYLEIVLQTTRESKRKASRERKKIFGSIAIVERVMSKTHVKQKRNMKHIDHNVSIPSGKRTTAGNT
jgi:hypothetical protein